MPFGPRRSPFPAILAIVSIVSLFGLAGAPPDRRIAGASPASVMQPRSNAGVVASAGDPSKVTLGLSLVGGGFVDPVLMTSARDGSKRLFVVEQAGRIRIISGGTVLPTPFLDLRGSITSGGERGLLGLAFHPKFATNHYIYVNFTNSSGNTAINRYTVGPDPNVVNRYSGLRILTITQPYANHNGGNIAFGPDGYLYIGMGDGGGTGDPQNRAQNLGSLLGKMLRIDVNRQANGKRYAVPPTNPFAATTGLDEIWSRGLRNPWRWSFDRLNGQLWIGDVGQSRWEEVDRSTAQGGHPAGWAANYGWPALEGRVCYRPTTNCPTRGKTAPLVTYSHAAPTVGNCSITGGFVSRGTAYPVLGGVYVFGDFCSGRIWGVSAAAAGPVAPTLLRSPTQSPRLAISSFGEDEAGNVYVVDRGGGRIYRLTATAKP